MGAVARGRIEAEDDDWDASVAEIALDPAQFEAEALLGLDQFSHAEIVFVFDQVGPGDITYDARHPRGRADWPKVGIFAQRGRNRPTGLACPFVGSSKLRVTPCAFRVSTPSAARPCSTSSPSCRASSPAERS